MPQNPWEMDWAKQVPAGKNPWEANWSGAPTTPEAAPAAPSSIDERSPGQVALDQAGNVIKGIPQAITSIPSTLLDLIKSYGNPGKQLDILKSYGGGVAAPFEQVGRGVGELIAPGTQPKAVPEAPEWAQAAQAGGAMLGAAALPKVASVAGKAASAVVEKLPSKAKAGANFDTVMSKAKDVPLELKVPDEIVLRALELRDAGSTIPKVLRDYIKKRESGQSVTYAEGRDFASNAGALSSREATAINAKMHRQVSQFAKAMDESNMKAAGTVGQGELLDQAMKEYSKAMSQEAKLEWAKKWAKKGVALYLLGKAAGAALDFGNH